MREVQGLTQKSWSPFRILTYHVLIACITSKFRFYYQESFAASQPQLPHPGTIFLFSLHKKCRAGAAMASLQNYRVLSKIPANSFLGVSLSPLPLLLHMRGGQFTTLIAFTFQLQVQIFKSTHFKLVTYFDRVFVISQYFEYRKLYFI